MSRVHTLALLTLLALPAASPAFATVMDFESLGLAEGTLLTVHAAYPGVSFTNAALIVPGNPRTGFDGDSSGGGLGGIDHANSGSSIAYPDSWDGTLTIAFVAPVTDVSLELLDVEVGSTTESVAIRVYDAFAGGSLLTTITVTGGDPGTGDGRRKLVLVPGSVGAVSRIEVERTSGPVGTNPGMAIDNVSFTESPTPATPVSWGALKALYRP